MRRGCYLSHVQQATATLIPHFSGSRACSKQPVVKQVASSLLEETYVIITWMKGKNNEKCESEGQNESFQRAVASWKEILVEI
jgi:hypothetical protein